MGKTIGIISSNREDHVLNGKDHRHNILPIGKTAYFMGKTTATQKTSPTTIFCVAYNLLKSHAIA